MAEVIKRVFVIFSTIYGKLWDQSREPELWQPTIDMWTDAISKFSPDIVLMAANNCWKYHRDMPPTMPQFIEVIKKYRTDAEPTTGEKMRLESDKVKSLDDLANLEGDTPIAKRELAKIRSILAGKIKELAQSIEDRKWVIEKYDRNYKTYNSLYAISRMGYLISVSDSDSLSLGLIDRYDRLRYINKQAEITEGEV